MNITTIKAGFKNWETTLIGIGLALVVAYRDGAFSEAKAWQDFIAPALIVILGFLMRDADKSSQDTGLRPSVDAIATAEKAAKLLHEKVRK